MSQFVAKYGGKCAACDERIHAGDLVNYTEDVLMHSDCDSALPVERKAEVCTKCWLTKPCDCEDHQ